MSGEVQKAACWTEHFGARREFKVYSFGSSRSAGGGFQEGLRSTGESILDPKTPHLNS